MTTPAVHTRDLPALASEINAEHEAAERAINDSLQHARRCGELLIEAKARCQHGDWGGWVEANFAASYRTAAKYMRLAARWAELANVPGGADLGINEALAALAEPREREPDPLPAPSVPRDWNEEGAKQLSRADEARRQRESQVGNDYTAAFQEVEDVPAPAPTKGPSYTRQTVGTRKLLLFVQDALRAADAAAGWDPKDMKDIQTNDFMVAGLRKIRDLCDRIIDHHEKRTNRVRA